MSNVSDHAGSEDAARMRLALEVILDAPSDAIRMYRLVALVEGLVDRFGPPARWYVESFAGEVLPGRQMEEK